MNPYDVLIRPLISEKSNQIRESAGQYTFQIQMKAGKKEVAKAVSALFNVEVEKVQTAIGRGKWRRRGQFISNRPKSTKKAIVTLKKGQTIKIFEDQ
jgi:large subunit ribosomal protein L23